MLMHACTS
jgi:hypothetical protein